MNHIPHNFITHKSAWRRAIETALLYVRIRSDRTPDSRGDVSYWEHELKAYDEAHQELEAMAQQSPQRRVAIEYWHHGTGHCFVSYSGSTTGPIKSHEQLIAEGYTAHPLGYLDRNHQTQNPQEAQAAPTVARATGIMVTFDLIKTENGSPVFEVHHTSFDAPADLRADVARIRECAGLSADYQLSLVLGGMTPDLDLRNIDEVTLSATKPLKFRAWKG